MLMTSSLQHHSYPFIIIFDQQDLNLAVGPGRQEGKWKVKRVHASVDTDGTSQLKTHFCRYHSPKTLAGDSTI
jgi:hypothetical protein